MTAAEPQFEPFRVEVPDDVVADLRDRLARTRWPDQLPDSGWQHGTDLAYLRELCDAWRTSFDWAAFAERFNRFPQWTGDVAGHHLHFFHVRSPEPDALPLLLSHGWPGSVAEFLDVLGPLSDPAAHGGDRRDAFHVVAPSLPGYGFSGPTRQAGVDTAEIARCFDVLMLALGYRSYVAQGGDWGSMISTEVARQQPEHVAAIHLNLIMGGPPDRQNPLAGLTADEQAAVQAMRDFQRTETGYQAIQRTKPQTLAYGLNDSPAGLAAWIVEKFHTWTHGEGTPEDAVPRDRLLDNISVYWLTGTIGSSMRLYMESLGEGAAVRRQPVTVPTGHAAFPGEIYRTPRSWAERHFPIRRWTVMPKGGHFAAMEVPDLFVDEIRAFFAEFRPGDRPGAAGGIG
jgi:epoxide hydrolase